MTGVSGPLEIERSYLLRGTPPIPAGAEVWRIEQGYLPETAKATHAVEGRLRRVMHADGTVVHVHTVKRGMGLVRSEVERLLDAAEFARLWPLTEGRRLAKTRHRVRSDEHAGGAVPADWSPLWEIDRFDVIDLVLAEVELPSPDAVAPFPAWLAPWVVREVTDEPEYRNSAIALRRLA